ncbi:YcgN family cysteine cluster protein [Oceanicaulis sp. UBA2681]|uniref:YcgN family cysteine cluster protein n=1 Tax=Oceanicaulis sp. UBA2681 TaxID=1947007 RepID=UPI000ED33A82|nr:YcgN family cysteine cluster protein [Oceanicaulis sp. UBA2681]HCR66934.1 YcgN family cysteine cluster protein [Oceanicaulis sp.]|tara:strand:+ start:304 stop:765 length:462 start_codon:yes stop_codon:yes gene_type:complete
MSDNRPFYERKSLSEMSDSEWESLCDGCGKCCVVILGDEDDPDTFWRTNVGCKLLDLKTVRCTDYANRQTHVPGCVRLSAKNIDQLKWMPDTCAYRLLNEGQSLPDWHPLKTGDPESVVQAGHSVKGKLVSENDVDEGDFESHIVSRQDAKRG